VTDLIARDGTRLAYQVIGEDIIGRGGPVVCLPGGPLQDSVYLGDLGGLSGRVRLIRFDLRGSGRSATPGDIFSTQPGAGHSPWLDNPTGFTKTIATFLA